MSKNFKCQKTISVLKLTSNSSPLGIISFLNHITFRLPSLDRNVSAVPKEQSRLGVGPVTTVVPDEDESLRSDMESTIEEEKTTPESESELSW